MSNFLLKRIGEDFVHWSGRVIQLYLEKGEVNCLNPYAKPEEEDMYVLLDKDGFDITGDYMSFGDSMLALKQDIVTEFEEDFVWKNN